MAKLFFLFLLLLAGAFFFTLTIGARRNDAHPMPASDSDRTQYAQDNPPPAWIGSLIGPLSPKLSLPQKEFSFVGDSLTVQAPAADSHFRNATLRIVSGCRTPADCSNIDIVYENKGTEAMKLNLDEQHWRPSKDKPDQASLVILREGGPIHFHCTVAPLCTAVLQ